jgi:hypothetical protein
MKSLTLISALTLGLLVASCTENQRAKSWGGTATIDLPVNTKLVSVTWKDANLWYITRPMRDGEKAETYKFQEESNFGALEGLYVITETRTK